jgi:hypothetical protein
VELFVLLGSKVSQVRLVVLVIAWTKVVFLIASTVLLIDDVVLLIIGHA